MSAFTHHVYDCCLVWGHILSWIQAKALQRHFCSAQNLCRGPVVHTLPASLTLLWL